jgi:uncharacterized LabA/DUF88 family protein
MDVELAVQAIELAQYIDQLVLFSGDGAFRSLVAALQRRGVRVSVVSTMACHPPMVADELRRQADVFIDIKELQASVERDPNHRLTQRDYCHFPPNFVQRESRSP